METFGDGERVCMHGLEAGGKLNGRSGTVLGYDRVKMRYKVAVDGETGAKPQQKMIRALNLRLASTVDNHEGAVVDDGSRTDGVPPPGAGAGAGVVAPAIAPAVTIGVSEAAACGGPIAGTTVTTGGLLVQINSLKDEGNRCFQRKDINGAAEAYNRAIRLAPRPPGGGVMNSSSDSEDDDGVAARGSRNAVHASEEAEMVADPALSAACAVVYLNRSLCLYKLKKFVASLMDAQAAAKYDPSNWKCHWRSGLALAHMAARLERSEQMVANFELCLASPTLPPGEHERVVKCLEGARHRLATGKDAVQMPEQCVVC